MSKVIKAWFNTIDLLRNEVQITNHALNTRVFRLKKHYLMAWLSAYRAIALKKKRLSDLKQFSIDNFARRYFNPWLNEARRRLERRHHFYEIRAHSILRIAFIALRDHVDQSNGNRVRAKKLIKLRARKLLAKVFYQGLYVYRRDSQLMKKLN